MHQKKFIFCMGLSCMFFIITPLAVAQRMDVTALDIHESVGSVIDADENIRYRIFGDITGFTAARFYKVEADKYQLHLLRNSEGRAQILILDLPSKKFLVLQNAIIKRINDMPKADIRVATALFTIEESKWADKSARKKIQLRDGSLLFVTLKRAQRDTLFTQTMGGLDIPIPDIHIADVIDIGGEIRKGKYLRTDPNTSRLFFAPTGRRLKAGNGYFADYFIFFPTLALGLTNFLSVSGGISLLPGAESQLLYFAPKFTLQASPKVSFGTGFLYLAIPEEDDLNLGYAVGTLFSDQGGVTLGLGLPLTSDSDQNPILLIGGEVQISNSTKMITENWIFTGEEVTSVFSGGIRFFGDKLAVDLALITTEEAFSGDGFPFLPWVDFSVFFGK